MYRNTVVKVKEEEPVVAILVSVKEKAKLLKNTGVISDFGIKRLVFSDPAVFARWNQLTQSRK